MKFLAGVTTQKGTDIYKAFLGSDFLHGIKTVGRESILEKEYEVRESRKETRTFQKEKKIQQVEEKIVSLLAMNDEVSFLLQIQRQKGIVAA